MKRIFSVCLIALMATTSIYSQEVNNNEYDWSEYRHSLSISAGAPSGYWLMRTILVGVWVAAADHAGESNYYGAYSMQYHYQALKWLRAGFKVSWEGDGHNIYAEKEQENLKGYAFGHSAALMASCQFTYLNRRHVQLYSGLDFGVEAMLSTNRYINGYKNSDGETYHVNSAWLPAINVTPIGVAFGNERVYGLAEVNIGSDALFKAGIGVHL